MIPIIVKRAELRSPSYETENKKDVTKPYVKAKILVDGADEFLTVGLKSHLPAGIYDMSIGMREYTKEGKTMFFFDLLQSVLSPPLAVK